jgi:hypothetical protein
MPKALCLTSLVVAIIIVVLFLADAVMGFMGMATMAPLRSANLLMDLTFIILGSVLAYMSFVTWREQR